MEDRRHRRCAETTEMTPASGCLVIMCGVPCSGKSTAAAELASALREKGIRVTVVDEPSLHLHRNAAYANGHVEKNTRGLLKATVDRSLHRDGPVVIVDACNGIKGYRYELWCIARQVGARSCVVHCDTPEEDARAWNEARRGSGGSSDDDRAAASTPTSAAEWGGWDAKIFDDLAFRFERPDGKNRWDAPLFTLRPPLGGLVAPGDVDGGGAEGCRGGVPGYRDPTRAETMERAVAHIRGTSDGLGSNGPAGKSLEPNAATQPSTLLSDTRLRAEIDAGAQDVVDALVNAGGGATSGGGDGTAGGTAGETRSFGDGCPDLRLRGCVLNLQTLRRLKRTFLKLAANGMARTSAGGDVRTNVKRMFVEYVQQHCDSKHNGVEKTYE